MYYGSATVLGASGMSKQIEIDTIISGYTLNKQSHKCIIINSDVGYKGKVQGTSLKGRYLMKSFPKKVSQEWR